MPNFRIRTNLFVFEKNQMKLLYISILRYSTFFLIFRFSNVPIFSFLIFQFSTFRCFGFSTFRFSILKFGIFLTQHENVVNQNFPTTFPPHPILKNCFRALNPSPCFSDLLFFPSAQLPDFSTCFRQTSRINNLIICSTSEIPNADSFDRKSGFLVAGVLGLPLREALRREAAQAQAQGDRHRDPAELREAAGALSAPENPARAPSD